MAAKTQRPSPPAVWTLVVFAVRYVTGQHLDGRRRSDATFLRAGTEADPTHWSRNPWWPRVAGWLRGLVRLVPFAVAWARWAHRGAAERASAVILGAAAGYGIIRAIRWREEWSHNRTVVRPLHAALARVPSLDAPPRARDWLKIPQDYATNEDAEGLIYPAKGYTPGDRDKEDIVRAVETQLPRLDTPEVDFSRLHGYKPCIGIKHSKPPPPKAAWADVEAAIAAAGPTDIVFGPGRGGSIVIESLSTISPHAGYQMGSGGGKTNLGSLTALQFLHRGDICLFIDAKLISYPWARGLPNVSYAGTIPEIHNALVWLGGELQRRNAVSLAGLQPSGFIHANVGPRLLIFAEELNFVVPQLKDYWADMRALDKDLPKRSPALAGLASCAFAGRQVDMHEFFIAQLVTAWATGVNDTSVRGNIGLSAMARYRLPAWQKLSDLPMPACPDIPGRIQVVTPARARETQVPYLHLDDKDEAVAAKAAEWARDYATSGVCTPLPAGMPGNGAVPSVIGSIESFHAASEQPFVVGHADPVLNAGAGPMGAVTLAEAVAAGLFVSMDAARQARQRKKWEPVVKDPRGFKYKLSDLYAYARRGG